MASVPNPSIARKPKTFVLCFDGTGNKFSGTEADSNILKIYRMLDKDSDDVFHYYQPGIGTYVNSTSFDHTSLADRIMTWCAMARDSAIGTSFAHHVMGGYNFLMRYYSPGDEIYLFGFSRGAYTARFLSEMLDWVGLLSAGNEELSLFAWRTFSKWQSRSGGQDPEAKKQEKELYDFITAFRETFSRPVKRIRFLGLFDTVNSVPRFEDAWMKRSKFPYSVKSSAKVIRHAVAIDERRARFRQDLVSEIKSPGRDHLHQSFWTHLHHPAGDEDRNLHDEHSTPSHYVTSPTEPEITIDSASPILHSHTFSPHTTTTPELSAPSEWQQSLQTLTEPSSGPWGPDLRARPYSIAGPMDTESLVDFTEADESYQRRSRYTSRTKVPGNEKRQDIEEVWFPGCHADIGGGWPKREGEEWPLSHAPLVWMVHEAQRAGLKFDPYKLAKLHCSPDHCGAAEHSNFDDEVAAATGATNAAGHNATDPSSKDLPNDSSFLHAFRTSAHHGFIHDCLQRNNGLPLFSVLTWNMIEYLPFKRMDLQPDGSWKPIRWPLPCCETRDIPQSARIHVTAIDRMKVNPEYRPGNLIVGGGGRGIRRAPKELGVGKWKVCAYEGDAIRECFVRDDVGDEKWQVKAGQDMRDAKETVRNLEFDDDEKGKQRVVVEELERRESWEVRAIEEEKRRQRLKKASLLLLLLLLL